jgi:cytochrome c peroxidase
MAQSDLLIKQHPPPPPRASSIPYMLGGVGLAAAAAAYLFFGTDGTAQDTAKEIGTAAKGAVQTVEQKTGLAHSQADYQKVYDAIAESLEVEGYDGALRDQHAVLFPRGSC